MTQAQDGAALPVKTNGINQRTTAHLNLERTMAEQIAAEFARKERYSTYGHEQRLAKQRRVRRIAGSPMGWAS